MINLTRQNYGGEILLSCHGTNRNEVETWYNRAFNYGITNSDLDLVKGTHGYSCIVTTTEERLTRGVESQAVTSLVGRIPREVIDGKRISRLIEVAKIKATIKLNKIVDEHLKKYTYEETFDPFYVSPFEDKADESME